MEKIYMASDYGTLDYSCGTLCVDLGDGNGPQAYTGGEIVVEGTLRYGVTWRVGVYVRNDDTGEFVPFSLAVGALKDIKSESSCDQLYVGTSVSDSDENGRCVVEMQTTKNDAGDVVAALPMLWKLADGTECDQDVTFRFPALECVPVEYWWYEEGDLSIQKHGCRDGWTSCEDPFTPLGIEAQSLASGAGNDDVIIPNPADEDCYGVIVRYALPDDFGECYFGNYDSAGVYITRSHVAPTALGDGTYAMRILSGLTGVGEITYTAFASSDFSKTAEVMDISGEDTFATYTCRENCPNQQFNSTLDGNRYNTGGVE